jgi:hypothetical protein
MEAKKSFISTGLLFKDMTFERPSRNNGPHVMQAAKKIAKSLNDWAVAAGDGPSNETEHKDLIDFLVDHVLEWDDGYKLTKRLEWNLSWDCDSEVVDILDKAQLILNSCYSEATKEWVKSHGIELTLSVGDKASSTMLNSSFEGEIVGVHPDTAEYTVYYESAGHVKQKEIVSYNKINKLGYVLACERVFPI